MIVMVAPKLLPERNQQQEADRVRNLLADLKVCSKTQNLGRGKKLHAEAVENGLDSNIYVASTLINVYSKCGSMSDARQVFEGMKHRNVVSWSALILGYAENGQPETALAVFKEMKCNGHAPNTVTFMAILKACISLAGESGACGSWVKAIHNLVLENRCETNICMQSTLIDMYSKCGNMVTARQVFDSMLHPDLVSWNVLILGYAVNDQGLTALDLFTRMQNEGLTPDSITFMSTIKACTSVAVKEGPTGWVECRERGRHIHDLATKNGCDSNVFVHSTLIDMYAKCGSMEEARKVFDTVKHPNLVSWTALILGYAENGQGFIALDLFTTMRSEGPPPDSVAFLAALKACGLVGALEFGRTIHSEIHSRYFDMVLVTCLVDFYAKCSSMVESQNVFDLHVKTADAVTWNALLAGFSSCGDEASVFRIFQGMQDAGFEPNSVTYLSILSCCSYAGLVDKGKECFDSMATNGVSPNVEHYTCMLDSFGRANKFDDAMALLQQMPCNSDEVTWLNFLGACRKWGNLEIGRLAFESLICFTDKDAAGYVLMGQIYGSRGMLEEQEIVMGLSKQLKAWKKPVETCWTNELGEVHTFSC